MSNDAATTVRTRDQVLHLFELQGVSVSDWARAHNFRRENVYSVLAGRTRGRRGEAHRISVALGLKPALLGNLPLEEIMS
jgi:gp16 family phage-associated protein